MVFAIGDGASSASWRVGFPVDIRPLRPSLEERVSFLEGRAVEQSNGFAAIHVTLHELGERMNSLEPRVDGLDLTSDTKVATLDQKLDQRFAWVIGLQVTTIVAFVGAVVVLLQRS